MYIVHIMMLEKDLRFMDSFFVKPETRPLNNLSSCLKQNIEFPWIDPHLSRLFLGGKNLILI